MAELNAACRKTFFFNEPQPIYILNKYPCTCKRLFKLSELCPYILIALTKAFSKLRYVFAVK